MIKKQKQKFSFFPEIIYVYVVEIEMKLKDIEKYRRHKLWVNSYLFL